MSLAWGQEPRGSEALAGEPASELRALCRMEVDGMLDDLAKEGVRFAQVLACDDADAWGRQRP